MAAEQSTTMVLKVDLQCCKCHKKVKKVLRKFPQIRDQVYDEKQNTVTIKVACCCDPEKFKQKIQCKGGKSIKSIDIKPPPPVKKPTPDPPPPPKEKKDPPPSAEKGKLPPPPPVCELCIPATCPPPYPCRRKCWGPCYCVIYYDGYCGRPVCDSWGGGCHKGYCRSCCTVYICEEYPNAVCSIM